MGRLVWKAYVHVLNGNIYAGKLHLLRFQGNCNSASYCGLTLDSDYLVTEREANAKLKFSVESCKNCEKVFAEITERRRRRK
jgi:hypothetical protein